MKNRKAKKGFTIIELVIVIAVIGILAGVLIPTFSNVIDNANKTAAMENARNAYTNYLVGNATDDLANTSICIKSGNYYFHVTNGQFSDTVIEDCSSDAAGFVHYEVDPATGAFAVDGSSLKRHTTHE